jgi:CubicO group peptidase (beta-lactamase class C family)
MQSLRFAVSRMVLNAFIVAASICCATTYAQGGAESPWPTREWQTSTPEEQGMDSTALAKLIEFGTSRSFDSLLIARHGRIVLDAYYAPYAADIPHAINSATKAVTATLTAIAFKDGLLDSLDHRMMDFVGDRILTEIDDKKNAITVQNLLDMTSGIDWREPLSGWSASDSLIDMKLSPDWIKFILDRPMSTAPGETFNYNSGNSQLLSAIITRLAGMDARDYAKTKLFAPLGIGTSNWLRDPQLLAIGGFGLAMLPRDMARIGYLYLRNGEWEDKRLLPPAWIEKVSHATVDMKSSVEPNLRYSNSFWALPNKQVYMAVGYHCQLIMVFPKLDIVAVTTARDFCPFSKLADYISGAVKSETALPADPAGANLLANAIHDISNGKP